jgi:hypothetical protein
MTRSRLRKTGERSGRYEPSFVVHFIIANNLHTANPALASMLFTSRGLAYPLSERDQRELVLEEAIGV